MSSSDDVIVGIDLGTTNSEIAAFRNGKVEVITHNGRQILPSCVGLSPDGQLLVGQSAANQMLVYPERTARSIKRKMGQDVVVHLGDQSFSPPEISALILKELVAWAQAELQQEVHKAVITVPAFFSDAQRAATREAGELAGLEVVRILNEPTAASLAYGYSAKEKSTVMVYDLGGGTFDCSIVSIEGDVTEVLASHGNNELGGDDFDQRLVDRLLDDFKKRQHIDLRDKHPQAYSRLWWAAEETKKKLSFEPYATIREENLATVQGEPLHLEREISREDYEDLIRSLVESTLDSVTRAMNDAGKRAGDLDAILLVGGSTRTPLIAKTLEERAGIPVRQDMHPDLCVALGAGILGSRLAGKEIPRVLVDVSPYSFGISFLGEMNGQLYPHCYKPIISRNTPLPVTRSEKFYTAQPFQEIVQIDVYQGDNRDALKNIHVGQFRVEGLKPIEKSNEVLVRMNLDLDGILNVTAIEKITGLSKQITITGATRQKAKEETEAARRRLHGLHSSRAARNDTIGPPESGEIEPAIPFPAPEHAHSHENGSEEAALPSDRSATAEDPGWEKVRREATSLLERSRKLLMDVHEEDREELIDLNGRIQDALNEHDAEELDEAAEELEELLFFIEGN